MSNAKNGHDIHLPFAHEAHVVHNSTWDEPALPKIRSLRMALERLEAGLERARREGPSDAAAAVTFREWAEAIDINAWARSRTAAQALQAARRFNSGRVAY